MRRARRLLIKAQDWLAAAAGVSRQRAPLKRMREVLHAGQRLGVDIPEVERLRLDIRRREWEDAAKKVRLVTLVTYNLCMHVSLSLYGMSDAGSRCRKWDDATSQDSFPPSEQLTKGPQLQHDHMIRSSSV